MRWSQPKRNVTGRNHGNRKRISSATSVTRWDILRGNAEMCVGKKKDDKKSRDCAFVVETNAKSSRSSVKSVPSNQTESTYRQIRELMTADQSEVWLINSGASRHLTYRREWLTDYRVNKCGGTISLVDKRSAILSAKERYISKN